MVEVDVVSHQFDPVVKYLPSVLGETDQRFIREGAYEFGI
jgi:hypothetical protein